MQVVPMSGQVSNTPIRRLTAWRRVRRFFESWLHIHRNITDRRIRTTFRVWAMHGYGSGFWLKDEKP